MKKRIAHNNINIFHSHENITQKNPQTYISYLKREKNGGKSATRKQKEKEDQYLHCLDFLPSRNHNMSVRNDGHVIISAKENHKIIRIKCDR